MQVKQILIISLSSLAIGYAVWFSLNWMAGYQMANHLASCAKELNYPNLFRMAKSKDEKQALIVSQLECTKSKLGFPASMLYDMQGIIDGAKLNAAEP